MRALMEVVLCQELVSRPFEDPVPTRECKCRNLQALPGPSWVALRWSVLVVYLLVGFCPEDRVFVRLIED